MRRVRYLLLCAFACASSAAHAKAPYGMAGCGLGSLLFQPDGGQLSAATTNGSTSSQGFGITSGTSNCLEPGKMAALSAQQQFIADNYSTLSKEISQGDGESLRAFADTFGCPDLVYEDFASQMQRSYSRIFAAPGVMAALSVVQSEIKANDRLASHCELVI